MATQGRCPDCGTAYETYEREGKVHERRVSVYSLNGQHVPVSRYVCPACAARLRKRPVARPAVQLRLAV